MKLIGDKVGRTLVNVNAMRTLIVISRMDLSFRDVTVHGASKERWREYVIKTRVQSPYPNARLGRLFRAK